MNAISRALAKQDRQRMEVRREAGAESGTDWATTLLFSCLHDKYGFGRNRFAAMNDMWEHLDEFQEGFIWATDAQRRWQELGRRRVLAARVPYRHHEELDKDIQEARRRGLSYGYWMARKTGILL